MKFAVESWSADYGAPTSAEALVESTTAVDAWIEAGPDAWQPKAPVPGVGPIADVLFVDGVQRVDANVWITDDDGAVHQGICASYAAGVVHCNGTASVVASEVRRNLFCPVAGADPIVTQHAHFGLHVCPDDSPEQLQLGLHAQRGDLERDVAAQVPPAGLLVVDGPLKTGQTGPGCIGFVKTHQTSYGPDLVRHVVTRLGTGERTPLLLIGGRTNRFSWYLRLPCDVAHGWAGVVRIETPADQPLADAVALADQVSVTLPRFASHAHKDPRAPQNLYPIGGLERELRRRMGDPLLVLRSLQREAHRQR